MELDIAIPAHNEEDIILPTLLLVSETLSQIPNLTWKIIVAENGSSDNTYNVVDKAGLPHVEIFRARQTGKGAAIKEAAEHSRAQYFGFIDADASVDPKTISTALDILDEGHAQLVIGSRFHKESAVDRSFLRHTSSRIFNLLARAIVGIHVNDTQCPLKVMNADAKVLLLHSKEDEWLLDLEHIARAEQGGLTISSIPILWEEFRYPLRKSKLHLTTDGRRAIVQMFQLRKRLAEEARYGA